MKTYHKCLTTLLAVVFCLPVLADDIHLELIMPGDMFGPGSPFSLELAVDNPGAPFADAELFVALTFGAGEFWFYPSWAQFPPEIDWENIFVPGYSADQWSLIPEFSWPYGAGSFDGAMFLGVIVYDGVLVSNLAQTYFGWSEASLPTPTPTPAMDSAPIELVNISPGTFTRGSPYDESCRWIFHEDQHQVTLTGGFYMMTTEVTRQMWADLQEYHPMMPDDPSHLTYSPTMDHPVQQVSWFEVVLFANLLSLKHGYTPCYYKDEAFTIPVDETNYIDYSNTFYCNFDASGFRLPTEAEWEYAARAGTTGPFSAYEPNYSTDTCNACDPYFSLDVLDSIAWWCGNSGWMSHPVGTRLANQWGLYDMHGNVWEWCWDRYDSYPYEPVTDPTGSPTGDYRVLRGGGWTSSAQYCRSAYRFGTVPGLRYYGLGFRLVKNEAGSVHSVDNIVGNMRFVPAGTFFQGSPADEPCRKPMEGPQFEHTLTRNLAVMETEITRGMWSDLKAAQASLPNDPSCESASPTLDHPAQRVTWYEAVLFANLLSIENGFTPCYYLDDTFETVIDETNYITDDVYCNFNASGYRLPTEGEREYFTRAGTTGPFWANEPDYSSGNCGTCTPRPPLSVLDSIAWWCGNTGGGWPDGTAHPVGTKLPNPWGLHDVHGNVYEWCWDWFSATYPTGSATDYTGPTTGSRRALRGGGWDSSALFCRSAHRANFTPGDRSSRYVGFRLVRTIP